MLSPNDPPGAAASPLSSPLRWVVIGLIVVVALGTRLPAPTRVDVIGDEMLHLESWRNRYRTDDILPLFRARLEQNKKIPPAAKTYLLHWYRTNPLFQRALMSSGHPAPTYCVLAEGIEAATHSSLLALRGPSVLFSLLALVVAYGLGRELKDDTLGLWLAGFVAISPLPQIYAGIGRPHAMSQLAQLSVVWLFAREARRHYASPWRLLAGALAAQTAHWAGWALIGPLVFGELIGRYLAGSTLATLARQTWWYVAGSLGLVAVFVLMTSGNSAYDANMGYRGPYRLWEYVCVASPFSHMMGLGEPWLWAAGGAFVVLIAAGLAAVFDRGYDLRVVRWPFLVALGLVCAAGVVMCAGTRHVLVYTPMPLVLSALGARKVLTPDAPGARLAVLTAVLAVFVPWSLFYAEDPYRHVLTNDPRYSEIAVDLKAGLAPGDVWITFPYFYGNPLFRWGPFPEPIQPLSLDDFHKAVAGRPADRACFVLVPQLIADSDPALASPAFKRIYGAQITLLKLPPVAKPPGG